MSCLIIWSWEHLVLYSVSGDRPIGRVEEKPKARKWTAPTKKEGAGVDNMEKNCILLTPLILLYVKCGHCQTSLCDQILSVLSWRGLSFWMNKQQITLRVAGPTCRWLVIKTTVIVVMNNSWKAVLYLRTSLQRISTCLHCTCICSCGYLYTVPDIVPGQGTVEIKIKRNRSWSSHVCSVKKGRLWCWNFIFLIMFLSTHDICVVVC